MKNKKRHHFTAPKPSPRKPPLESTSSSTATPGDPAASAPPKKKHTGVSRYSLDFAILICERIATTPQPVSRICQAPDMPGVATIFRWLKQHPDFREMYWEAKQMQAELFLEDALEIVDDDSNDLIVTADGKTLINRAALQRCKMRVEHRRWIASKLLPRRYGASPREAKSPASSSSSSPHTYPNEPDEEDPIMTEEFRMQVIEARRQIQELPPEDDQDDQSPDSTEPHPPTSDFRTPNSDPQSPIAAPPPPRPNMWRDVIYPKPKKTTLQKAVS